MPRAHLVLLSLVLLAVVANSGEMLKCLDAHGKTIFTDKKYLCRSNGEAEQVELKDINTHSDFGGVESEEFYNYAHRSYITLQGYRWKTVVEKELFDNDSELTEQAARRLEKNIAEAIKRFPPRAQAQFDGITYYLFYGERSTYGGSKGGLWYFRSNNRIAKRLDNSIIVRSARNYRGLSDLWALKAAAHELSHAYHYYNWRGFQADLLKAYKNAKQKGLYRNVKDVDGRNIETAYALTNYKEYFAELSAIYFTEGNYDPFNRRGLQQYDPLGYALIQKAWWVADQGSTPALSRSE